MKEVGFRELRSARLASARLAAGKLEKDDRRMAKHSPKRTAAINLKRKDRNHSILLLNDDCLLEILTHLKMEDLCQFRECCERFRFLADSVAEKRFRKEKYVRLPKMGPEWWYKKNLAKTALVLSKFGKFITHLSVDDSQRFVRLCNRNSCDFVTMIRDCIALKELQMKKMDLRVFSVRKMKSSFHTIETLKLNNCQIQPEQIATLLKAAKVLKHFTMNGNGTALSSYICSNIIRYGQNLRSIRFKRKVKYDVTAPEFFKFVQGLRQLRKLKTLEICNIRKSSVILAAIHLLAANTSLERLRLSRYVPDGNFFEALRRIVNLKVCKLHTDEDITPELKASANDFDINVVKSEIASKRFPFTITIARRNLIP